MTRKAPPPKPPTHGWQVLVPVAPLEDPTDFEQEYAHPRVYLDKARAERARVRAERDFLREVLPRLDAHVGDWFVGDEGVAAEAADTFFALPVELRDAFWRAFISPTAASDAAVREGFRKARFFVTRSAPPRAWEAARRIVSPYLPMPSLGRVRILP